MAEFTASPKPESTEPPKEKKSFVPNIKQDIGTINTDAGPIQNFINKNKTVEYFQREYDKLSYEEKKLLHESYQAENGFTEMYKNLEKFIFKVPPPSPAAFLDPANGWLSKRYVDKLFQWVKDDFIEICSGHKYYDRVIQYGCTRGGKTTLAVLMLFYLIVWIHHLRDMNIFYDMAPNASLSIFIMSFNYAKVNQLYLKPLYNLMEMCPRFVKVKNQDAVSMKQKEYGMTKIVWSKASLSEHSCMTFSIPLQVVQGNDDALSYIGENVLACFMGELAFFIENAGASEDSIFRLYTDIAERIHGTVGNNKYAFVYLDSSANREDSKIESFMLNELRHRENTFFRRMKRWDVPELHNKNFPIWKKTGETFKICTGDGSHAPRIFAKGEDMSNIPPSLLLDVPIDALDKFRDNLIKSIKDVAGFPTVNTSRFIQNARLVDSMWDQYLPNIEGIVTADSSSPPQKLIWNKVHHLFFTKFDGVHYRLKRASREPRWIHLDTAYSVNGDVVGITMVHKEYSQKLQDVIYVCDFSFTIGPGENGINLESLGWFIKEMISEGQITLGLLTVDTFQSESMLQFLRREGINAEKLSVDTSLEPYMFLYSCLLQENVRVGKNIFLKNNLLSLFRKTGKTGKEKIDHTLGTTTNNYNGDFEKSSSGTNAKDCSDSLAGALFNAQKSTHFPSSHYEKENERLYGTGGAVINASTPVYSPVMKDLYKSLHRSY